jgi:hypothetical protein
VKGHYVLASPNGKEIGYSLLVPGEKYLDGVRSKPKRGTLDEVPESEKASGSS